MELTPFQRVAAFAVVVLVLAGLGTYLFLPHLTSAATSRPGTGFRSDSRAPASPASRPATSVSVVPSAASAPASPDIYQWLPFTPSGLARAAATTTAFAAHYGTYSYTETAQAYLSAMRPLMTTQLAGVLGQAFSAPGLVANRAATKQVATATATIVALRAFGPGSMTFVVAITQRIASTKGVSKQTTDYAVTLTGNGSSWQVNDVQLASAGNQ